MSSLQNRLPDIEYTPSTVKIGLHKLLNENVLNSHIQTSVEKMTKITYEGSTCKSNNPLSYKYK
nr:847_t:CDS:2 [Entrophospora candida]